MSSMRQCLAMTAGRALRGAPICLPTALGKARGRGRRWVKENQAKARFSLSELEHSNRGGERADHLGQRRACAAQGMGYSPTYSAPSACQRSRSGYAGQAVAQSGQLSGSATQAWNFVGNLTFGG